MPHRLADLGDPDTLLGLLLPWAACWSAIIAAALGGFEIGGLPGWWQWAPLGASLVLFGLPHGAVDHLQIARLAGRRLASPAVIGLLAGYLAAALGVVALWSVAPVACFVGFIAVTWLHWGQGDLWFLRRQSATADRTTADRLGAASLRGAVPILGPLVWHPEAYRRIYGATTGLFGAVPLRAETWTTASWAAGGVLAVLAAGWTVRAAATGAGRDLGYELLELSTLFALFAAVPGIFAVGLYFCTWHGPRHVLRLADLRGPERPDWSAVSAVLSDAIPLTVASAAGGAALGSVLVSTSGSTPAADWAGWYLVVISGLTVPHTLVVLWMDRRETLWRAAPRDE